MKKHLPLLAGLLLGTAAAAETPVLNVYAPDYFGSEWGPGPGIEAGFEEICACDLKFVTGDVLPRLLLEGERTEADVVIGLNTDVAKRAREQVSLQVTARTTALSRCQLSGPTTRSCPSTGLMCPSSTTRPRSITRRRALRSWPTRQMTSNRHPGPAHLDLGLALMLGEVGLWR